MGAVDRLEQSFAPGSESAELAAVRRELEDPERCDALLGSGECSSMWCGRYRANWETAVMVLEKHIGKVEKQGLKLQQLLQYSFDRLEELEQNAEEGNAVCIPAPSKRTSPLTAWSV